MQLEVRSAARVAEDRHRLLSHLHMAIANICTRVNQLCLLEHLQHMKASPLLIAPRTRRRRQGHRALAPVQAHGYPQQGRCKHDGGWHRYDRRRHGRGGGRRTPWTPRSTAAAAAAGHAHSARAPAPPVLAGVGTALSPRICSPTARACSMYRDLVTKRVCFIRVWSRCVARTSRCAAVNTAGIAGTLPAANTPTDALTNMPKFFLHRRRTRRRHRPGRR